MSDTPDPMIELLRERRTTLLREVDDIGVRIIEIDHWLSQLADGRSRIAKRRKGGNSGVTLSPFDEPAREAADAGAVT